MLSLAKGGSKGQDIDLDNFERLMGIELLAISPELALHLTELSKKYR